MGEEYDLVETVLERETDRLRGHRGRLRTMLDELLERYPTAHRLAGDVEALEAADAVFVGALRDIPWEDKASQVTAQLRAIVADGDDLDQIALQWDDERGRFWVDSAEPMWRARAGQAGLDVDAIVAPTVDEHSFCGDHGPGVTYPLIFTHEVETNHRAVARTIGWALVIEVAHGWLRRSQAGVALHFQWAHGQLSLRGDSELSQSMVPESHALGFSNKGELFRRLRDFEQVDPGAHWIWWKQHRPETLSESTRELRQHSGARLSIEVSDSLRRLRIIERARSTVVRKRHHIFVEPHQPRRFDRYFASEQALEQALQKTLKRRIDEGFRIVDERD